MSKMYFFKEIVELLDSIFNVAFNIKDIKKASNDLGLPSVLYNEFDLKIKIINLCIINNTKRTLEFERIYVQFSKNQVFDLTDSERIQTPIDPIKNGNNGYIFIDSKVIEEIIKNKNINSKRKIKYVIQFKNFDEVIVTGNKIEQLKIEQNNNNL